MSSAMDAKPEVDADHTRSFFWFFFSICCGDATPERRLTAPPGMDLEEAYQVVGEFGPYQKRAVAVLVLTQVGVV